MATPGPYNPTLETEKYKAQLELQREFRRMRAEGYSDAYIDYILNGNAMPKGAQMMRRGFKVPQTREQLRFALEKQKHDAAMDQLKARIQAQQAVQNADAQKTVDMRRRMEAYRQAHPEAYKAPQVKVKGERVAQGAKLLGGLISSLAGAGAIGEKAQHRVDPLSGIGGVISGIGDIMGKENERKALTTANEGLVEEADDLIQRFGMEAGPEWVKMELIRKLMQQREEALRAYYK